MVRSLVHLTFDWAGQHPWWFVGIMVVGTILIARLLLRPVPEHAPSDNAGKIAMAVALAFVGWLMFGPHGHPVAVHHRPVPAAKPPVTHTVIDHVTSATGLSGWALAAVVIVAVCVAGAVALNTGGRE